MKDLVKALTDRNEQITAESMAMIERLATTIESQAREIERLSAGVSERDAALDRVNALWRKRCAKFVEQLAALKAQPSGVVLPERRPEVTGTWGDMGDAYSAGVNDTLDEVALLNQPASAGDPIGYFVQPYADSPHVVERVDDSCAGDDDVFPLYRHPSRAALSANHSEQVRALTEQRNDLARKLIGKNQEWKALVALLQEIHQTPLDDFYRSGLNVKINAELVRAAAPSAPSRSERVLDRYTCIGKGGDYQLLGIAQGAGTLKGFNHMVYRNVDGVMFVREPEDFLARMEKIAAAPSAGSQGGDI